MYDAVVVGARCAGASTAMLLARQGWRVLLADKDVFPSDRLSSHFIHPSGIVQLRDWGLLDDLVASGCPAMEEMTLDFGAFALHGRPTPLDGVRAHYAPRRIVLDDLLVRAAAAAGADLHEGLRVRELVWDDGRVVGIRATGRSDARVEARARVVIGADGPHSTVARAVGAPVHRAHPRLTCAYYGYWRDVESRGVVLYARPGGMVAEFQTNDDSTVVYVAWPQARFPEVRRDVDNAFMRQVDHIAPDLAARLQHGVRSEPIRGSGSLDNFMRRSAGRGWALAGDAAAHKDPYLASGISDALRDAHLLTAALNVALDGRSSIDDALRDYDLRRTAAIEPLFELNAQLATLQPPPPDLAAHLASLVDDQAAIDRFLGAISGTLPLHDVLPALPAARADLPRSDAPTRADSPTASPTTAT